MKDDADVIVIGAGASGLVCAREAALRGRRVVVVDRAREPGRKILVSGGGRCNFTNLLAAPSSYASENPMFCASALAGFQPADFVRLVEEHGIPYREEDAGRLFCDRTGADIRDMLVAACGDAGARFLLEADVKEARREGRGFTAFTSRGELHAARLVVAAGSRAAPATGATGTGTALAEGFGMAVIPPEPALVGLRWDAADLPRWRELAGITVPSAAVTCRKATFHSPILFTHTGLSGPAILDASLHWRSGDEISVDLAHGIDAEARLRSMRAAGGSATAESLLREILPGRLAYRFAAAFLPAGPLARVSDAAIAEAARAIHGWRIVPAGTEGWERAEVARGGVDTRELSSKTMEARRVPGLFFTGEVVDVTGRLGGYNLHWAWASGAAAGRAA